MADRSAQEPGPEAALPEDRVGALERRDPGPGKGGRIRDHPVALGQDAEPVLEPAHHQGDDRPHRVGPQAGRLTPRHAALDRVRRGNRLRDGERDRGVDADAPERGLLHRRDPGPGRRELDDDVRRSPSKPAACWTMARRVAEQGRVRLHREPALSTAESLEAGSSSRAPSIDIAATIPQASSRSDQVGFASASWTTVARHAPGPSSRRRGRSSDWPSHPSRRWRSRTRARRRHRSRSRCRSRRGDGQGER